VPTRHPTRWLSAAGLLLIGVALAPAPGTAWALGDSGGHPRPADTGVPRFAPVPAGTYAPPVDRRVVDPFRLDAGPYGPGNRGLEYATLPGDTVRAVAAGRVAFVGPVAGRLVVSIDHPDGRRSTLTRMQTIAVQVGDVVARGTPLGSAATELHLGLLEGRRYVDPALFLGRSTRRAVLIPLLPADP
jgi:murein DD-endopeptidase MepM/ murein hydrolase activator NlpD